MKKFISTAMIAVMCSSMASGNTGFGVQPVSASAVSADWQEAYADFLKNGGYGQYITSGKVTKFTTAYIDGDDIPELALSTGTEWDDSVFVATFKNGKITPVKAFEAGPANTYDTTNGFYGASGKLRYAEKGGLLDPDFYGMQYAYRTIYNVNNSATAGVETVLYRYDTEYVNGEPVFEYAIDSNTVTESEYNEKLSYYENKITSVIDYHDMLHITEENINAQFGVSIDTQSDEKETSGKCGDNAYWNYDESTGTLTISGTGSTYDYWLGDENPDWWTGTAGYKIKRIVVEEGITKIGYSFFYGQSADVKLPESLEEIGDLAFHNSSLKEITVPKNVKKIGTYAFGVTGDEAYEGGLTGNTGFTVYGYSGSVAEDYVNNINDIIRNGDKLKFVALDSSVPDEPVKPDETSKPEILDTSDTSDISADWKDSCKKILKNLNNSSDMMWDLYDIDGNGIPELIVSYGNSHVSYCEVYAYDGSDFVMMSTVNAYGNEQNSFGHYGEIYAINGKNQFETYDINNGTEVISFFTLDGNNLKTDITFENNSGAVGEDSANFYVNNKKVSKEDYDKAYEPYSKYDVQGNSVTPLGRKYKFENYDSVLETYDKPVVPDKLSESELKEKSEKYGNVSAWEYHDYDNNGTNEAFALITEETKIKYLLFIDSDGNITEMSEPKNKGDFLDYVDRTGQYTETGDGQGFFSADMTGGAASFTLLYSVKNNIPYELDISGMINGSFKKHENNTFSAWLHDEGRVGSGHTYELIYNNTDKQFQIGNRLNDSVSENVTSGKCGDNAYWTLDKSTGKLTISGKGDIYDYGDWAYETQSPPWCDDKDYGSYIKNIVIEEGITGIGVYNFYGSAVESVKLPESLKKIESLAFHDCENLKEIRIPKNVTEIGDRAFGQYGNSGLGVVDGFVVYGYKGSEAEKYVNNVNNIEDVFGQLKFVAIQDSSAVNTTSTTTTSGSSTSDNTPSGNNSAGNSSSAGKSAPATGDNIAKVFSSVAIAGLGVILFRKRNRK
ncbi:MAG: leucine-rich repeat domain-containing protein [Ruminococcus sp.]|nr:leucine-rich repeat domain-containing protein [Ruminococcus sp.]